MLALRRLCALSVAAKLQAAVSIRLLHTTATVIENGRKLSLAFSESGEDARMTFHTPWLRHNCHCAHCLTSSGQNTVSHECLSEDLKVSSANVEGDKPTIIAVGRL